MMGGTSPLYPGNLAGPLGPDHSDRGVFRPRAFGWLPPGHPLSVILTKASKRCYVAHSSRARAQEARPSRISTSS